MSSRLVVMVAPVLVTFWMTFAWGNFSSHSNNSQSSGTAPDRDIAADVTVHPHPIYAPGTDLDYVAEIEALLHPDGERHNFQSHWSVSSTANNTGGSTVGDSLVLTWSIVPDGTVIPGGSFGAGEPACNSNLIAVMNGRYGNGVWQAELQEVFNEWSTLTGNTYIREANDDGAAWPTSRGAVGTRGDIRVSGCNVDGNSGILAYNFFPSIGDMKIDTTDSFFDSPQGALKTGFHYVLAHEHGHGVGLAHVCPINATKLMEPFINTGFNTLRHDDIRGAQRGYGDGFELPGNPNDSAGAATLLGTLNDGQSYLYTPLSIDDNSDQDWLQFTVGADRQVDVTLAPVGFMYEDGNQSQTNGQCQPGPTIDSKTIHNLDFQILDSDGVTVLAAGNTNAAGINEALNDVDLGNAGVKYLRIFPAGTTDDVQLYDLTVVVSPIVRSTIVVTPQIGGADTIFTAQLTDFLPSTLVTVAVNGQSLGTVMTNGSGGASFGLDSTNANDGRYYVRVSDGTDVRTGVFIVDADAPVVPATPAPIFPIPAGIGYRALYLPAIVRNR